jgi:hypothetical protein
VTMRMPTLLPFGEGCTGMEAIDACICFDPPRYWARRVRRVIRVIRGDPFAPAGSANPDVAIGSIGILVTGAVYSLGSISCLLSSSKGDVATQRVFGNVVT